MSQVTVNLNPDLDKVVGIIKSAYGLSSKDKAIQVIIEEKAEDILRRELQPEFVKKMVHLKKKGKFKKYVSIKDLRDDIEHA